MIRLKNAIAFATLATALTLVFPCTAAAQTASTPPAPADGRLTLREAIERGATIEEFAQLRQSIAATPTEAVRALKAGNARFFGGVSRQPELSANERRAQMLGQKPFATILACSDSRAPTEILFDQGLGTLFVVRVAGNVIEPSTSGTIEYGIEHLKTLAVVVMGHESCGAVGAAMLTDKQLAGEPEGVRYILGLIAPAVTNIPMIRDTKARMREAVVANVRLQVDRLRRNTTVSRAIREKRISVVGAYYEISSGAVDFLETEEELRIDGAAAGAKH